MNGFVLGRAEVAEGRVRQPHESWTVAPQPPLPAVTEFVSGGWSELAALREAEPG
jgi:hypothetical protein